jgi:serine O-acetyltransferase
MSRLENSSPPARLHTWERLRADARHYNYSNGKRWYTHSGFWVGFIYRYGHCAEQIRFVPLRVFLLFFYVFASAVVRTVYHVSLPRQAVIGPGFCMHHPQNIIVPGDAIIGRDVTIYQEVTIGRGPTPGVPTIGNEVIIYAGAKVLGGITVGDECEIGANVVVTRNFPARSVVSVPPARAIPKETIERLRRRRPEDPSGHETA